MINRLNWVVGGPQGSGINAVAETFAKACVRGGLNVFANIEYHSNIKGEHSFYRVRVDSEEVHSHTRWVDLLVALDRETLFGDIHKKHPTHAGHRHEVMPGNGGIIFDSEMKLTPQQIGRDDIKLFPVPYKELLLNVLREFGKEKELSKYQVIVNTIALGASFGLLGYNQPLVAQAIKDSFAGKTGEIVNINIRAMEVGYHYMKETFEKQFIYRLEPISSAEARMMIRGVQAVALAKLKAGCAFQTYYPITPATDESEYLESVQGDYNILVFQAEDEIAAIMMAVGAAHAGLRASTSTSGPGFSLMMEGLGWAGATEAPGPVIILYQRAGPSTGMPTRTEQGDLKFAVNASHGEFPRIVLAPGDVEECFYLTFDAFNYAEQFQLPVILLADKHLATSYRSCPLFSLEGLSIERGALLSEEGLASIKDYKRYALTESGISPRSIPGQPGGIFWAAGEEHDEYGHLTESAENRAKMMRKRMRKLQLAAELIPEKNKFTLHGDPDAEITLVSWGSTKGAILDALGMLAEEGVRANFLQIKCILPFPAEPVERVLSHSKLKIAVENNYSAQLAGMVREYTGIKMDHKVMKFDGRAFSENDVYEGVMEALKGGVKEVMVVHA